MVFKCHELCANYMNPLKCDLIQYVKSNKEAQEKYDNYSGICHDYTEPTKEDKRSPEEIATEKALSLLSGSYYKCTTDTKEILVYDNESGIYEPAEPFIHKLLEVFFGNSLKRYFVKEIEAHLQRRNYIDRSKINRYTNKIPIKNGLFNFETRETEPFDHKQVYTYSLNIEYDPEATCPKWKKFVKEIIEPDAIPLLQEIMGYCLLPSIPFHKIFWFYGIGRNGKGVVIRTLEAILGKDTCAHLNLSEFTEHRRFSLCQLYGKLINVSSEPQLSKYGLPTQILKMITGQDTINAELKGKNKRLDFLNFAKPLILGNRFPKVDDDSLGWWDRVIVLEFPNSFEGEKEIQDIEKRWIPEEISAIFNWMLEGLYRLYTNRQFSTSKSVEETKAEYMKQSNPFTAWLIENCIFLKNAYLTRDEALTDYENYCNELDLEKDTRRIFYEKLRRTPKVTESKKMVAGKTPRVFEGLTLKASEEKEQKSLDMADMAGLAGSHSPKPQDNPSNNQIENSANSAISALDETFNIQCFDCGKTLQKNEVYSFGVNPFCRECRLKIEEKKKGEAQ